MTVPPGVLPGDVIHVISPESGRLVEARVPNGMFPGSSFMVKSPATPIATAARVEQVPSQGEAAEVSRMSAPTSPLPSSQPAARPFSMALDDKHSGAKSHRKRYTAPPQIQTSLYAPARSQGPGSAMMMVQVPPSAPAGATIHVRIPGEDRVVATKVPANCTEFLVSYEPAINQNMN